MPDLAQLPLAAALLVFLLATAVIGFAGTRIARIADALADVTGWGEALFGAVLLGASTSLSGIVTSVSAASSGHAELAFSNAIGGIAAQTVILVVADLCYRHANLEHAAASLPNMMHGTLLIILMTLVLIFMTSPDIVLAQVHPGSVTLIIVYLYGLRIVRQSTNAPAWRASRTPETVTDEPDAHPAEGRHTFQLWARFAAHAAILIVAGIVVARTGVAISHQSGMSETIVGAVFTAVATSLPELVTSIAAVRQGALTLAVGNIIGGNSFEVLLLPLADVAYRDGSLYHAVSEETIFFIALSILLVSVLLLGLLRREKRGIANIGFESFSVLLCYIIGVTALFYMH